MGNINSSVVSVKVNSFLYLLGECVVKGGLSVVVTGRPSWILSVCSFFLDIGFGVVCMVISPDF